MSNSRSRRAIRKFERELLKLAKKGDHEGLHAATLNFAAVHDLTMEEAIQVVERLLERRRRRGEVKR